MRVLLCLGLMFALLFGGGCATDLGEIQVDPEDRLTMVTIAGRHVGAELEKRYPDVGDKVLVLCQDLVVSEEGEIISDSINSLVAILTGEFIKDPILEADIQDLVGMLKIKPDIPITSEQELIIKAAAQGLINGIELQREAI